MDAFIDTFGGGYVQLALELGVAPYRIDTIVRFEAVAEHGVKAEGNAAGASASTLAELARLIAAASSRCRSPRRSRSVRSGRPTAAGERPHPREDRPDGLTGIPARLTPAFKWHAVA